MDSIYDGFAKYYRELITASGHLDKEYKVIEFIAADLCPDKNMYILDAACGTGEALKRLYDMGFNYLSGLDASISMIKRAKQLLPKSNLYQVRWQEMSAKENLRIENGYDLIYVLSMSLPHAVENELNGIFRSFYSILSNNGVFVFDNRKWEERDDGSFYENNRSTGIYLNPRKIVIGNEICIIEDKCDYKGNRQFVTYKISSINYKDHYIIVSYAMILTAIYKEMLLEAGFSRVVSKVIDFWPYELIYAYK
jgi:SAM-dependent methyltransferase